MNEKAISPLLEICCYNVESVRVAADADAHRVELCSGEFTGGGTPPLNWLNEVCFGRLSMTNKIKVNVMLHPREGNYCYDEKSFELLKQQIAAFKMNGADGFVFGVLNGENKLDLKRNSELVKLCSPLPVTLHKAFDEVKDPYSALEDAITCGFTRILTYGTKKTALEGKNILRELVQLASGKVIIMAGGSIRSTNLSELLETGATEFHSSSLSANETVASEKEIKAMLSVLQKKFTS